MKIPIHLIAVAALIAPATQAQAQPVATGGWSRPAKAGMNGAGFMVLGNPGAKADALVGASSPIAGRTELHLSSTANGVMIMRRQDRVALPAGGAVRFAPGGYHLMFIGLKKTLGVGDRVPVTLSFASGRRLETTLVVAIQAP